MFYSVTHGKLLAYADDYQLYSSDVDPVALENCICREVRVANEWYRNNRMIVNETKHQAIVFGKTDHSSFPLKDSLDIFGINIDNRLRFVNYISTICKKINGQFNVMLRFRKLISKDTLLRLYKAFINFIYFNTEKMDTLNKRILRFILQDYNSPYDSLLSKVNSKSLYKRRLQTFLIILYKSLFFYLLSSYLRNMFSLRSVSYSLRGNYVLFLPSTKSTTYGHHSFSYMASKLWNSQNMDGTLIPTADTNKMK